MRECRRLGAVHGAGLREDTAQVMRDGVRADEESGRDLPVRLTAHEQPQHRDLALGEAHGRTIAVTSPGTRPPALRQVDPESGRGA